MIDSMNNKLAPTPTRWHEKITLPKVRESAQLVRAGRRRSDTEVSVRVDSLSVSRARRRDYHNALRRAGARYHAPCRWDQDSQMSPRGSQCLSCDYSYGRHCGASWIEGKRNGIISSDIDGPRITGACCRTQGAVRRVSVEVDRDSAKTFESRQRSR